MEFTFKLASIPFPPWIKKKKSDILNSKIRMTAILPLLDPGRFPTNCVEPWERMRKHPAASKAIPGRERKKNFFKRVRGVESRRRREPREPESRDPLRRLVGETRSDPAALGVEGGAGLFQPARKGCKCGSGVLGESGRTSP